MSALVSLHCLDFRGCPWSLAFGLFFYDLVWIAMNCFRLLPFCLNFYGLSLITVYWSWFLGIVLDLYMLISWFLHVRLDFYALVIISMGLLQISTSWHLDFLRFVLIFRGWPWFLRFCLDLYEFFRISIYWSRFSEVAHDFYSWVLISIVWSEFLYQCRFWVLA